jgi:hypothetical protein
MLTAFAQQYTPDLPHVKQTDCTRTPTTSATTIWMAAAEELMDYREEYQGNCQANALDTATVCCISYNEATSIPTLFNTWKQKDLSYKSFTAMSAYA